MHDIDASLAELRTIWERGPGIHKTASDLDRYEWLISTVKPVVVVETGLYFGGSQLWFAERVPWVINVESNEETTSDYLSNRWELGNKPDNALIVVGDSTDPKAFATVLATCYDKAQGGPVVVVLDSDHSTEVVLKELDLYSKLVTVGSYLVVEDTILHHLPRGGFLEGNWYDGDPLDALERWLPNHPEFVVDTALEDWHPTTQCPGGWLKRVK